MINEFITQFALLAPPFLFALTLHELAHGYVAYRLGDPTAKMLGRLSLNPIKHLDPIGTIVFFLINIGWAKPVPVNPANFKNPKKDMLWVSLAGPLTNLALAVISIILAKAVLQFAEIIRGSQLVIIILKPMFLMLFNSIWINLVLCVFNILPIPPLDGSKILMGILPDKMGVMIESFEKYGFILILLLAVTGAFSTIITPLIYYSEKIVYL